MVWPTLGSRTAKDQIRQGTVATYLRCGGDFNNQIKKGLSAESVSEKNKIGEYLAKLQART